MRAFVIGNGPSLNSTPMAALRDEFTVGCNRFDLLGLDWDPTYWIMADVRHEDGWWDWPSLLRRKSQFVFREQDRPVIGMDAWFFPRCEHIGGEYVPRAWHLPILCDYGGSISVGLQIAVLLGANPIYLLGCDLYRYRGPEEPDINHFHAEYCPYKIRKSTGAEMITPEMWEMTNNRIVHGHEIARTSARAMGVEIYNATIGGSLEVYQRVRLQEIL